MLKYLINTSSVKGSLSPIVISDFTVEPIIESVDTTDDGVEKVKYGDKYLLTGYCDSEPSFNEGARIVVQASRLMPNDDLISSTTYNFSEVYQAVSVNKENRTFSLLVDRYFNLSVKECTLDVDEAGEWVYIRFQNSHMFDLVSGGVYKMYITYDGVNGYNISEPLVFYVGREEGDTMEMVDIDDALVTLTADSEYISSTLVRVRTKDMTATLKRLLLTDPTRVNIYRDEFIYRANGFELFIDTPMATLSIPMSQKFETDLLLDEAIRDDFTKVERKKAINSIVDMEKDVYHPVIWNSKDKENGGNYGAAVADVYKIRFNLHFRQHSGENWLVEEDSYWNGVKVDKNDGKVKLSLDNDYFNSYNIKRASQQSDLLTYLNFTDKDVRYQKNKLKKSFLRVMFFDSTNPTNQNMLAYYTIFLDGGSYFSKFARYIETDGYRTENADNLVGIKVNREPTKTSKGVEINKDTPVDEIEAVRLSSQLVVEDKYMSDSSSEGFYLHLWKDNMNGVLPTEIYMKVEFNHAGYGRTIPFMMPYWDPIKHPEHELGIKSFEEILDDWSGEAVVEYKETQDGQIEDYREYWKTKSPDGRYGLRQYLKYTYIRFKYKYDKVGKRHVYYLDDELYGDGVYFDDNAITLNLYEAKVN